jgi:hypothetical protein
VAGRDKQQIPQHRKCTPLYEILLGASNLKDYCVNLEKDNTNSKRMSTQILDKKIELIQWLSALEDKAMIEKLLKFRNAETKDWWESISSEEKESIAKGLEDAKKKKLKPHSSARKLYEKWL